MHGTHHLHEEYNGQMMRSASSCASLNTAIHPHAQPRRHSRMQGKAQSSQASRRRVHRQLLWQMLLLVALVAAVGGCLSLIFGIAPLTAMGRRLFSSLVASPRSAQLVHTKRSVVLGSSETSTSAMSRGRVTRSIRTAQNSRHDAKGLHLIVVLASHDASFASLAMSLAMKELRADNSSHLVVSQPLDSLSVPSTGRVHVEPTARTVVESIAFSWCTVFGDVKLQRPSRISVVGPAQDASRVLNRLQRVFQISTSRLSYVSVNSTHSLDDEPDDDIYDCSHPGREQIRRQMAHKCPALAPMLLACFSQQTPVPSINPNKD